MEQQQQAELDDIAELHAQFPTLSIETVKKVKKQFEFRRPQRADDEAFERSQLIRKLHEVAKMHYNTDAIYAEFKGEPLIYSYEPLQLLREVDNELQPAIKAGRKLIRMRERDIDRLAALFPSVSKDTITDMMKKHNFQAYFVDSLLRKETNAQTGEQEQEEKGKNRETGGKPKGEGGTKNHEEKGTKPKENKGKQPQREIGKKQDKGKNPQEEKGKNGQKEQKREGMKEKKEKDGAKGAKSGNSANANKKEQKRDTKENTQEKHNNQDSGNLSTKKLKHLTDCKFFMTAQCVREKCFFRHNENAKTHNVTCPDWMNHQCMNVTCVLRHPPNHPPEDGTKKAVENTLDSTQTQTQTQTKGSNTPNEPKESKTQHVHSQLEPRDPTEKIAYFWDIENCPVPRSMSAFDVAMKVRKVLAGKYTEHSFSCFGDITTFSEETQHGLHIANVKMIHVPDRKPGGSDRTLLLELDRFERTISKATIVLITGDIDFIYKLNDLKHHAGYRVVLIHNTQARRELIETADRSYSWTTLLGVPAKSIKAEKAAAKDPAKGPSKAAAKAAAKASAKDSGKKSKEAKASKECQFCSAKFKNPKALGQHTRAKHPKCSVCQTMFVDAHAVAQHMQAKGHWFCFECSASFSSEPSLEQHQRDTGHCDSDSDSDYDSESSTD